ncbi:MAG: aspartate--tRNA(Asn) ligase [Bacilli bacterium]|jgi:nondiscriminating aspartyl-tRNA synthetase
MERIYVKDLKDYLGKEIIIKGFLKKIRELKQIIFIDFNDISGDIQLIVEKEQEKLVKKVKEITLESAIKVNGKVRTKSKEELEIEVLDIECFSLAEKKLPIDFSGKTETSLEIKLDWRYLDLRNYNKSLIFKVQTLLESALREYFKKRSFIEIHSPKIIGAPSESGAEVFELNYYEGKAFLAQSPQFYKQMGMAAGLDKVYEIGPVFRADRSSTNVHAAEFTGIDAEISWIDSEEEVMKLKEEMLVYTIKKVKEVYGEEIKTVFKKDLVIPSLPFPRIKMKEALEIVKERGHSNPGKLHSDLDSEGERLLGDFIKETKGHDFVFVTDFPYVKRPFYHMKKETDPTLTKSFDLLYGGVEITTGAQREHRYDVLLAQSKEKGLSEESIGFYLDFFKYGCPPHGGFGSGLARILMVMLGFDSIKDVSFIFRNQTRLWP